MRRFQHARAESIAQWVGCLNQCYADCNIEGVLTVADRDLAAFVARMLGL